jgi:hypothetical protein
VAQAREGQVAGAHQRAVLATAWNTLARAAAAALASLSKPMVTSGWSNCTAPTWIRSPSSTSFLPLLSTV